MSLTEGSMALRACSAILVGALCVAEGCQKCARHSFARDRAHPAM